MLWKRYAIEQRLRTTPSVVGGWLQHPMHYVQPVGDAERGSERFTGAYFLKPNPRIQIPIQTAVQGKTLGCGNYDSEEKG